MLLQIANKTIAIGALIIQAGIVITLVSLIFNKKGAWLRFVSLHSIALILLLSFGGVVTSLFYSEVIGYAPCVLCWYQRIFMYPQMIIAGIALAKKDSNALRYLEALSWIGFIFALYHVYIDFGGSQFIACDSAVSCTQRYVAEFGYLTIPSMALTLFVAILITVFVAKKTPLDETTS